MNRAEALRARAGLKASEGIYVTKPANLFYLTGYTGEGVLAVTSRRAVIVTDFRYTEQAAQQAPSFEVEMIERGTPHAALAWRIFEAEGVTDVLYEDDGVTVREFQALQKAMPGAAFRPLQGVPEDMRKVKDEGEIASIRKACAISCEAFQELLTFVKAGMTEKEAQLHLDYTMLSLGADALAFHTIAAAGAHGSLPHAVPSDRVICEGDMLTLDFGARKNGYDADMTRTIAFGEPSAEMKRVYETVLQAQLECEAMLRPGASCREIDAHARRVIDGAGYAGRFGHGLGHGVGIDIHEQPRLSTTSEDLLFPGHIVTVEPGIYIPGLGGVRIEDTCVITEDGFESLVTAPKELLIL
ncbi:MAG: aminopeptidase P family protein [Clostridia bacterium]|nr:aminopeptidase P family protein [Clostridia bacterium]